MLDVRENWNPTNDRLFAETIASQQPWPRRYKRISACDNPLPPRRNAIPRQNNPFSANDNAFPPNDNTFPPSDNAIPSYDNDFAAKFPASLLKWMPTPDRIEHLSR